MNIDKIEYREKTANEKKVFFHLQECKNSFNPPLDQKVDISEYSKKIMEKAITFEAWAGKNLIGLIATYFNDKKNITGYITSVSVTDAHKGKGIASQLLHNCIDYAKKFKYKEIQLEVSSYSLVAIKLYQQSGFIEYERKPGVIMMKLAIK